MIINDPIWERLQAISRVQVMLAFENSLCPLCGGTLESPQNVIAWRQRDPKTRIKLIDVAGECTKCAYSISLVRYETSASLSYYGEHDSGSYSIRMNFA